jgi:hypothetical protein
MKLSVTNKTGFNIEKSYRHRIIIIITYLSVFIHRTNRYCSHIIIIIIIIIIILFICLGVLRDTSVILSFPIIYHHCCFSFLSLSSSVVSENAQSSHIHLCYYNGMALSATSYISHCQLAK